MVAQLYQRVADGFGMSADWVLSIVVQILRGRGDIRNCICCRAVKLLEHGMKVVERVLVKSFMESTQLIKNKLALYLRGEYLMLCLL